MNAIHTTILEMFQKKRQSNDMFKMSIKTKNSFLNPKENFGKMETGVSLETKNFERELPNNDIEFEII